MLYMHVSPSDFTGPNAPRAKGALGATAWRLAGYPLSKVVRKEQLLLPQTSRATQLGPGLGRDQLLCCGSPGLG